MNETISGGCLCGAVRYELRGRPIWAHACHCSRCRRSSGTAFAANLFAPGDALFFTSGEAEIRSFEVPDAERFEHVFCGRCGSSLPFHDTERGLVGIPMGTLDADAGFGLRAHIFVDSMAPWYEIADDLPQHVEGLQSETRTASRRRDAPTPSGI